VNIAAATKEEERTTALVALTAHKALEEQCRCERATALTLEKEKEVAWTLTALRPEGGRAQGR
jgi:hypothetical protein